MIGETDDHNAFPGVEASLLVSYTKNYDQHIDCIEYVQSGTLLSYCIISQLIDWCHVAWM